MVKRKCGTCKYFQDKGLANSGWCRHPERCDLQDMVLVRKAELACRNGWDRDLWERAGAGTTASHDEGQHPEIPHPTDAMLPPGATRSVRPLAPPLVAKPTTPDPAYTDKLTAIGMRMTPRQAGDDVADLPALSSVNQPIPSGLSPEESRQAVRENRRRREEARKAEVRQTMQTIVREAGDLLDDGSPEPPAVTPPAPKPPTITRPNWNQPRVSPPPPLLKRLSEPPLQGSGLPERDASVEFASTLPRFRAPEVPPVGAGVEHAPVVRDSPSVDLPSAMTGSKSKSKLQACETEPFPVVKQQSERITLEKLPSDPLFPYRKRPAAPPSHVTGGNGQAVPAAPQTEPLNSVRPRSTRPEVRQDVSIVQIPLAMREDPINTAPAVSTIPRCCETCRDFKRHGDSDTGWCGNPHAFAERRMVRSQELACRSSIGVWWLPHDDLWLERVDTTHHGLPTPILDEELRAGSMGRQRMGPRSS